MMLLFIFVLLIALLLEGTVTTLPLVLVLLLCLTITRREAIVFPVAFVAGVLLDILTLRTVGVSSLFFTLFLFLILLYQRKYEINSYPFVAFAAFFGAVVFLLIFGYSGWFGQSLFTAFLAVVLFGTLRYFAMNNAQRNLDL
jgi:cell shape-determining protein MreD